MKLRFISFVIFFSVISYLFIEWFTLSVTFVFQVTERVTLSQRCTFVDAFTLNEKMDKNNKRDKKNYGDDKNKVAGDLYSDLYFGVFTNSSPNLIMFSWLAALYTHGSGSIVCSEWVFSGRLPHVFPNSLSPVKNGPHMHPDLYIRLSLWICVLWLIRLKDLCSLVDKAYRSVSIVRPVLLRSRCTIILMDRWLMDGCWWDD